MAHIQGTENVYFEWNEENVNHIKRHNILPHEVEEAYLEDLNKKVFFDETHSNKEEQRFIVLAISKTTNKFIKFVICFYGNRLRVITAHKATNDKKLLKLYK